jgi:hypothetical protein
MGVNNEILANTAATLASLFKGAQFYTDDDLAATHNCRQPSGFRLRRNNHRELQACGLKLVANYVEN